MNDIIQYDSRLLEHCIPGLNGKWNAFIQSLPCRVDASMGIWICGGTIRRALLGQKQEGDVDYFFRDAMAQLQFTDSMEASGATVLYECPENRTWDYHGQKIQEIKVQYYPTIESVLRTFDYTICQFGFTGVAFYTGAFSLFDLGAKRLRVNQITNATASTRRLLKYMEQGFTITNEELMKFLRVTAENPVTISNVKEVSP